MTYRFVWLRIKTAASYYSHYCLIVMIHLLFILQNCKKNEWKLNPSWAEVIVLGHSDTMVFAIWNLQVYCNLFFLFLF